MYRRKFEIIYKFDYIFNLNTKQQPQHPLEMTTYTCGCTIPRDYYGYPEDDRLTFDDFSSLCKHLRRKHCLDVRYCGMEDAHGHCAYCFGCEGKNGKNHRSFDSEDALLSHIKSKHSNDVVEIKTH